jgi:hypothetical protein
MTNEMLSDAMLLKETDYYLDESGRVVIDNPDVLQLICGAGGDLSGLHDMLWNGACSNGHCG